MRYYMIRYETLVGEKSKTTTRECLPFPIGGSYLLAGRFTLRSYYERISQPESRMDKSA